MSNAIDVFQFVRVEDIAYDPDDPPNRHFADTGNDKLTSNGDGWWALESSRTSR